MAWTQHEVSVWRVCWKWIFPYPCKKRVTRFCCTGNLKWRVWGLGLKENYFCCDGKESHWFSGYFGFGWPGWHFVTNVQICRGSIPSESEGCPNLVGEFPEVIG